MISYDIVYLRPDSVAEAVAAWQQACEEGLQPAFLSGGSELLTAARENRSRPGALIDLKRIDELGAIVQTDEALCYGSSVTLTRLCQQSGFQLLSQAAGRVADRTVRNSITLGGNVCGMLPYRETLLPFLVADGSASIAGPDGTRSEPLARVFNKRLRLQSGELLVSLAAPQSAVGAASFYRRRERDGRIDYPLLTLCAVAADSTLRIAVSGVYAYPLRSLEAESALQAAGGDPDRRAAAFVEALAEGVRSDMRAAADYRRELLRQVVAEAIRELEGSV